MKKIIIALPFILIICFACANTSTKNSEPETTSIISETKIEKIVGMPNPMTPYETLDELTNACDFKILYPTNDKNYSDRKYFLISGTLADCRLTNKDNNQEVTYRSAKGTNDISGYFGYTPTNSKINDIEVHTYKTDDGYASWWTNNDMSFSISAKNIDENSYKTLLNEAIDLSK